MKASTDTRYKKESARRYRVRIIELLVQWAQGTAQCDSATIIHIPNFAQVAA